MSKVFCSKSNTKHDQDKPLIDAYNYSGDSVWRPAHGGKATPFEHRDKEWLYMYNMNNGKHAYYNITDDKFDEFKE